MLTAGVSLLQIQLMARWASPNMAAAVRTVDAAAAGPGPACLGRMNARRPRCLAAFQQLLAFGLPFSSFPGFSNLPLA